MFYCVAINIYREVIDLLKSKRFMISIVAIVILLVGIGVIVGAKHDEKKEEIGRHALEKTDSKVVKNSVENNLLTNKEKDTIDTKNASDNDRNQNTEDKTTTSEPVQEVKKDTDSNKDVKKEVHIEQYVSPENREQKGDTNKSKNQSTSTTPSAPATQSKKLVKVGSTSDEVISIMGNPTRKENMYFPKYEYWYNDSVIFLLDSNDGVKVIGWYNYSGNLKVSAGEKSATPTTFTLGSSREDVARSCGTPYIYDPYYYLNEGRGTHWEYSDGSRVDFDCTFKVVGWTNKGSLKVKYGEKKDGASAVTLGSSLKDLLAYLGTPTALDYDSTEIRVKSMTYKNSIIYFDVRDKVCGWINGNDIGIKVGKVNPSATPIKAGSTIEEVFNVMGTPDELTSDPTEYRPYMLIYGKSAVYINTYTQTVESWTNAGNLKVE